MSVLEFISSLKWPLFLLITIGIFWWRIRRNPSIGQHLRQLMEARNIRMNLGGQELELTRVEEAAGVAARSDTAIAQAVSGETPDATADDPEVLRIRRAAIEELMTHAAHWGWATAQMGFQSPPDPAIQWNADGQPEISFASGTTERARLAAIWRRLSAQGSPPNATDT